MSLMVTNPRMRTRMTKVTDSATTGESLSMPDNLGTKTYSEPHELTGQQWDKVFTINRVFHGYQYNPTTGVLVKAAKPAFRLRSVTPVGEPSFNMTGNTKDYFSPIPPFFVYDDANVHFTEVQSQKQKIWAEEGFNSVAINGSLGRGPYDFPVSIEESCDTEQSEIHKSRQETGTRFLHITYDVPKAVIELDPDCLELTEQCKRDATGVTNITGLDHFYRQYGTIFVTRSTLGGYLNNTRNVGILSKFELDQMKDEIRIAVRTSMQASINRSGSADIVKMNTKVKKNDNTFPPQDILLAWDVHGGDTLLFPNMAAWTGSVKDHRLWRLMDQRGLVSLKYLIYDVDSIVWSQLHNLPPENYACNIALEDVFGALKLEKHIPSWMALAGDREDYPITKQIVAYYRNGRYDTADRIKLYNDFIKANFKHNAPAIISPHSLYGDLSMARKIGFGIYMIKKGELKFDYLPPGTSHTRFW